MKRKVTKISNVSLDPATGKISFVVGVVYDKVPKYWYYQTFENGKGLEIFIDDTYRKIWNIQCWQIPGKNIQSITHWLYEHYEELAFTVPILVSSL